MKSMEAKSGAKIAIRGKGSVKEGKGRNDPAANATIDEDLHCLVMADTEDKVTEAIRLIEDIIATVSVLYSSVYWVTNAIQAASTPESQNKMKLNQLRELASLNGTLRDDENQVCQNCKYRSRSHIFADRRIGGEVGHRRYDCPQQKNYTTNIICRQCGNAGHMARDCKQNAVSGSNNAPLGNRQDQEYESLMNELGEGNGRRITGAPGAGPAPWEKQKRIEARKSNRLCSIGMSH